MGTSDASIGTIGASMAKSGASMGASCTSMGTSMGINGTSMGINGTSMGISGTSMGISGTAMGINGTSMGISGTSMGTISACLRFEITSTGPTRNKQIPNVKPGMNGSEYHAAQNRIVASKALPKSLLSNIHIASNYSQVVNW